MVATPSVEAGSSGLQKRLPQFAPRLTCAEGSQCCPSGIRSVNESMRVGIPSPERGPVRIGAVLAAAIMSFPLMVRAFRLGFDSVDPKLEVAAHSLGANRFVIFLTITLPLIIPALITGAVLGFAKSMGEFGATITFVSNIPGQTQTIPSAIFEFLQLPGNNFMTIRLVCLSLLISIGALYISEVLASRLSRREQS